MHISAFESLLAIGSFWLILALFSKDVKTTGIQVSPSGMVPSPSRISREDVADLAVSAATFESIDSGTGSREPFHYTFGMRWVGEEMAPFPSQGRKNDGLPNANLALKRALSTIYKSEARSKSRKQLVANKSKRKKEGRQSDLVLRLASQIQRRKSRVQPHGICVALPVYFLLALFVKAMLYPVLQYLPGGQSLLVPAFRRMHQWTVAMITLLGQFAIRYLPPLARRTQYIPF